MLTYFIQKAGQLPHHRLHPSRRGQALRTAAVLDVRARQQTAECVVSTTQSIQIAATITNTTISTVKVTAATAVPDIPARQTGPAQRPSTKSVSLHRCPLIQRIEMDNSKQRLWALHRSLMPTEIA